MNQFENSLGKTMTAIEVARYLKIDIKTVRKYYLQLGGVRFGRVYRFFERRIADAIQTQWKMVGTGQVEQQNCPKDISNQTRSQGMGGRAEKKVKKEPEEPDPYGLLA